MAKAVNKCVGVHNSTQGDVNRVVVSGCATPFCREGDVEEIVEVAADALGVVIDSGFCKDERLGLIDLVKDIELAEDETMVLRVEVDQALVRLEEDLKPLDALCLYKVVSLIASLAGTAQDLGDQLIISVSV